MTETAEPVGQVQSDLERFVERAQTAAAFVTEVADFAEAISYTIDLCGKRNAIRLKVSAGEEELCEIKQKKIIAAPGFEPDEYKMLEEQCINNGYCCLQTGIRSQLAGVDIGFSYADVGLAETGTLVLNCPTEELRLATMICEYHVCVLPKSRIVKDGFAAEQQLRKFMSNTPNYTAFITGPSRTADIERVLTIGVHGPLELHILVVEG